MTRKKLQGPHILPELNILLILLTLEIELPQDLAHTMFASGRWVCGCLLWERFMEGNLMGSLMKKTGFLLLAKPSYFNTSFCSRYYWRPNPNCPRRCTSSFPNHEHLAMCQQSPTPGQQWKLWEEQGSFFRPSWGNWLRLCRSSRRMLQTLHKLFIDVDT